MPTLPDLAAALAAGTVTARSLVEDCLARIADPAGEGARAFLKVYGPAARAQADAVDALRRAGCAQGPYAGIPVSLKDLLDVAGEPTPAGSTVLADATPAAAHAPLVQRLVAAGFVPLGRTNMTEFAYSGLGINPHYGTPRSPWGRDATGVGGCIPGGSSSGAAVSVSDGMAFAAIGTDTGGSCRIPAAMCGIVGYKPTSRRVPTEGVLPLSGTLDSVGPLAGSVACCAIVDAVLAGEAPAVPEVTPLAGLRLAAPTNIVREGLHAHVSASFDRALATLRDAGAVVVERAFPEMEGAATGPIAAAESFAWHRLLLAEKASGYDPRVRKRIEAGRAVSAAEYVDALRMRAARIAALDRATRDFDAMVMPTCPLPPPRIDALDDEGEYNRVNLLQLRNTALGNYFDRCAISLPCHRAAEAPVGLMLVGPTMGDARLFRIACGVEAALAGLTRA